MLRPQDYPPGMIGLPCSRGGHDSDLLPSILALQKPAGTVFQKTIGLGTAAPLNEIGREFLKRKELEWLFLTNDDNLCPPDTIPRLLSHGIDAVTGLYLSRVQPFEPIVFDRVQEEGPELAAMYPEAKRSNRWYYRRFLDDRDGQLVPIVACGDGCLMIRREVMEQIPEPWWEYGETLADACDHDVTFSRKVREAGFDLYCDLGLHVGHITSAVVYPFRHPDGRWVTHIRQADRGIEFPAARPDTQFAKERK